SVQKAKTLRFIAPGWSRLFSSTRILITPATSSRRQGFLTVYWQACKVRFMSLQLPIQEIFSHSTFSRHADSVLQIRLLVITFRSQSSAQLKLTMRSELHGLMISHGFPPLQPHAFPNFVSISTVSIPNQPLAMNWLARLIATGLPERFWKKTQILS